MDSNNNCACKCGHHKMVPALIVLIGLNFLLVTFGAYGSNVSDMVWPILLILVGFMKMFSHGCKCCGTGQGKTC